MYGMVNKFFQEIVGELYGEAKWEEIKQKANLGIDYFVGMEQYPDEISYNIVGAATEVLSISAEDFLMQLGERWIGYTAKGEYKFLYQMAGSSFVDFLQNLDNLHANVGNVMPDLKPPSFKCTEIRDHSLRLHYYSDRPGLAPFVMGLARGLGQLFRTKVEIALDKVKGVDQDHDEFLVTFETP